MRHANKNPRFQWRRVRERIQRWKSTRFRKTLRRGRSYPRLRSVSHAHRYKTVWKGVSFCTRQCLFSKIPDTNVFVIFLHYISMGMDMDLAVENLSISGTVLASLSLDSGAPFPHASHLSLSFVEKPDVWFSVRLLRSVQMMEVPLLKTWIHAVVSDALASWLVDPGHLEIDLRAQERPGPGFDCVPLSTPQAVLTVSLGQVGAVREYIV